MMNTLDQPSPAYVPANLNKVNQQGTSSTFAFDSPHTIAKQQNYGTPVLPIQAGGAPALNIPIAPAAPQLQMRSAAPFRLRTRDWSTRPWGGNNTSLYYPPATFLTSKTQSSYIPIYLNSSSAKPWRTSSQWQTSSLSQPAGLSSLSSLSSTLPANSYSLPYSGTSSYSTTTIPTAPLSKGLDDLSSTNFSKINIPTSPSNFGTSSYQGQSLLGQNNLYQGQSNPSELNNLFQGQSNLLGQNNLYQGQSNLYQGQNNLYQGQSNLQGGQSNLGGFSNIPPPPLPQRRSTWRKYPQINLRTKDWGQRSSNGWSNFNNSSLLQESFLKNRPRAIPAAPPAPSFLRQRTWNRGPYRQRNLRSRNWGDRTKSGWSSWDRSSFQRSIDGIEGNHARLFKSNFFGQDSQRGLGLDQQQQQFSSFDSTLPTTTTTVLPPTYADHITYAPTSNFASTSTLSSLPAAAPLARAPLATAPLVITPQAAAPLAAAQNLKGRKGRRAQKKLARQAVVQSQLTARLPPPAGDPAVNHYRRGAPAAVPLVGPTPAGIENGHGNGRARRIGRRNNRPAVGKRRANWLPVPATQPPAIVPSSALPLGAAGAAPGAALPLSTAAIANTGLAGAPAYTRRANIQQSLAAAHPTTTSTAASAGIPLSAQSSSFTPLSAQPSLLEKREPIQQSFVRPTGSATF